MKQFKVGCSPVTSDIFAGYVNDDKGMWVGKKHNVTETSVGAVAQHIIQLKEDFVFGYQGKKYALRVVELTEKQEQ
jgi:hypothetical protein